MRPAPAHAATPSEPPTHAADGAPSDAVTAPGVPAGRSADSAPSGALPAPGERGGRFQLAGGLAANGPGRGTGSWAGPVALTALLVALAAVVTVLQKSPCLLHGWGAPDVYYAGCYSDWAALYGGRGFAADPWAPFRAGSTFEYPVLMSVVGSVAAWITQALPFSPEQGTVVFWLVNLGFVVVLWAVVAVLTVRMAGRRWTDGLMVAVAPGIVLAGTINWDLWAVALLACGMYAWSRDRSLTAGVPVSYTHLTLPTKA